MGRGDAPTRSRHPLGPLIEDGHGFDIGPPLGWGPPPPGDWGPPPPGGWPLPPDEWCPPPPGGWGPPPPGEWGPRGPPSPGWGPRGPPPPGWGPHPDDWMPHPEDWGPLPEDWRPRHPDDWRRLRDDWGPDRLLPPPDWGPPGWGPEGFPEPWGHEPGPPVPIPPPAHIPPPALPPPSPEAAAYGTVPGPPGPPPACIPPFSFPPFPPPVWAGQPVVEDVMPNPPPDQPEWIKALISAPASDSTPAETKTVNKTIEPAVTQKPDPDPAIPPASKLKPEPSMTAKPLGLLGKRMFDKPPPGRSTGIISFVGPTFGYIEREDLEKFSFSFQAFFGNPKAMTPGVRVHFTACREKNSLIAADVKVAPGGTENVDPEIYEAVVSQPIVEPQPGERQYPGQVHVDIGPLRTNLTFDRKDSAVTLLKNDQVLINLLTDIVTEKRRATNIKPQIPATFCHTKETRETGVIITLKDNEGAIKSDEHGELAFDTKENFSDVEFTVEDINEEVEFTVITLRAGKRAIRIRRVKEPLLLTLCSATAAAGRELESASSTGDSDNNRQVKGKANVKLELGSKMVLDTELYEGVVSQTIIEPTGYPGQIHANIGPIRTNVTFDHRDCGVTLLKNDHVLINLLIDLVTRKRRAANIKPKIPFTFSYTKEKRELGIITSLGAEEGVIRSEEHGELPFDICENFSDTEFNANDVHKEVEFTMALVKTNKRAIRLRRTKMIEDKILHEQKLREEEEKKKKKREEEERKKQEEEERKRREEKEAERKKEEVAAALAAAKHKWTPLGFKIRDPNTLDDISKECFEGTVLKAISKNLRKDIKKPPEKKNGGRGAEEGQMLLGQIKIKVEKMDEAEEAEEKSEGEEGKTKTKEVKEDQPAEAGGESRSNAEPDAEMGRLVMTIDGQQKQLPFSHSDLLTSATMLDGDKVRFNIATHRETGEERAAYVEILPDSFEESTEQRRHGIVIEFSEDSGLIKCTQNPQLYFNMSEVIEKKKLELNEKVEFSVIPHETAEGGNQAVRIKRYTENVFLPVRKLGGVSASKGKMTINLTKAPEDTEEENPEKEKLKAVVKNLRAQDSKTSRRDYSAPQRRYGRSRSRSRSKGRSKNRSRSKSRSRSPPRDKFGRVIKRRRSTSVDRDRKTGRYRRSRSRERSHRRRSRTKSCSRSRSRSKSSSRSRSRSKDRVGKRRSKISRERDESHRMRRELSPPPKRVGGVMDDELARKKRELEELNEMIAYKKALVDPRGLDPGKRTCIDYDHGRIAVPLAEYKPVRSILKKRPEGPEYHHRPPQPYEVPYYDRAYGPYEDRRYGDRYGERYSDPYTGRPYAKRPYTDQPYSDLSYENRLYGEPPFDGPPSATRRYTDRYDVYDEPYDDRYYDSAYADRPYDDPYCPVKRSQFPEARDPPSSSQSGEVPGTSTQPPLTHSVVASSSQSPYRPPSPREPPPRSPSPKLHNITPRQSPPAEKPPLDRFLDMLNKKVDAEKKLDSVYVNDDLLPHERALQDGRGFSRIVGLAQEQPSSSMALEGEKKQPSPKRSSVERNEEPKSNLEPYDKIQSLLRTIGLKLSTGDVSKLASRAQEKIYSPKSSSTEREALSFPREEQRTSRTGSLESDHIHSPSTARSDVEPLGIHRAVSDYEGFLDQQELEALEKAQQLQSLTKTMESTPSTTTPPKPPPAHYQHAPPPISWPLGVTTQVSPLQSSTTPNVGASCSPAAGQPPQRFGPPPGPAPQSPGHSPPGPPPRRSPGQPPFIPPSSHAGFPFIGQPSVAPPPSASSPSQHLITAVVTPPSSTPAASSPSNNEQSAISTTVARCLKVIETVKSLAVQPSAKLVKSVQFSLPTESPSPSSPQTSVETDDDIKNKQKEKLDLYNQRIMEKREQQFQEMLARKKQREKNKDGTWISTGKPISSEPKNVWICGHSLVYWAESRAKSPEVGMQLGMDPSKVAIWWKGTQGMTWAQLLPQLHQLKVTWPNPDVLIVHLGGNDLSTDSPTDLLASVKKDLTSMRSIFPQCFLVWSNILPRRVWRHSPDSHEVDLVRTTVNRRIQSIISELGGTSLTHDNIRCGANTGLYRPNGVHLSPKGIDVFNLNVQDFLEKWELEISKASEIS
ncbi:hypothetical protein PAMP_002008 [Pampus punctatissimus]